MEHYFWYLSPSYTENIWSMSINASCFVLLLGLGSSSSKTSRIWTAHASIEGKTFARPFRVYCEWSNKKEEKRFVTIGNLKVFSAIELDEENLIVDISRHVPSAALMHCLIDLIRVCKGDTKSIEKSIKAKGNKLEQIELATLTEDVKSDVNAT